MTRLRSALSRPGVQLFVLAVILAMIIAVLWFINATISPRPGVFYDPPDPLPAGEPGAIIRSEPVSLNVPPGAVAWRVLYHTTDMNGRPIASSGLVVAPAGPSDTPRPIIAWAMGTQGIQRNCGTSHLNDPFRHISIIDLMIREGYVVAATDYHGRGTPGVHPYLIGRSEAHAVLDSVRAARHLDTGAGDEYAIWGASQGGHATLWSAYLAPEYAPELRLVAAAAQASAIDLYGIFSANYNRPLGGFLMSQALFAWGAHYEGADVEAAILPEWRDQVERVSQLCFSTPLAFLTVGGLPAPVDFLAADPRTTEPWRSIIEENSTVGAIDVPLLITHGTADSLIPLEGSENEAARRCAAGEDVTFMRFPGVPHPGSDETGVATLGWIEDRFAGRPSGSNCGK